VGKIIDLSDEFEIGIENNTANEDESLEGLFQLFGI